VEYFPIRAGELLCVMAIEQHRITLIGQGDHYYRAWYFAAHDWPTTAPVRPADLFVVMHPNPVRQTALVEHAPQGCRNGYQYHLIFDVAERLLSPS
jgi:hypothetical protein